jgi:hypothetical protein
VSAQDGRDDIDLTLVQLRHFVCLASRRSWSASAARACSRPRVAARRALCSSVSLVISLDPHGPLESTANSL